MLLNLLEAPERVRVPEEEIATGFEVRYCRYDIGAVCWTWGVVERKRRSSRREI
jgi:hypothetical protein